MTRIDTTPGKRPVDQPELRRRLEELIIDCGGNPDTPDGHLVKTMLTTSLKLITDGRDSGELKLLTHSQAELRHAMRVFAGYAQHPKVSIFGSARTPEDHPDYRSALEFAGLMARHGWLSITGAGDGIMKAGHEGSGRDAAFGLAIRLPFETSANSVIEGDTKLINFKYFFTRKTMFLSQSQAVAAFPGGFGTQDELMETLTLVQTGKSAIVPIVLLEGSGGNYWRRWEDHVIGDLEAGGFISSHDRNLYYRAPGPLSAVEHITRFYTNYHSSRYVGDDLVVRVRRRLLQTHIEALNDEFTPLVRSGVIHQRDAYGVEAEHLELPRIAFTHTRRNYGLVRVLIDRINGFAMAELNEEMAAQPQRR